MKKLIVTVALLAVIVLALIYQLYLIYGVYGDVVMTPIEKLKAYWVVDVIIILAYTGTLLVKYFMKDDEDNDFNS